MQILFVGAVEHVTGSCTLVTSNDKNILVDCGLYEGNAVEHLNARNLEFDPKKIDYILLTHAHIDHSGKIPYLVKRGFRGKVICTRPTKDLCDIMLPDSGYIQQKMMKWDMKAEKKQMLLYDMEDAYKSLEYFEAIDYDMEYEICEGIKIKMTNAGHMLGSAFIEMFVKEKNKQTKIVFTGDIGNQNINLLPDYKQIESADVVVMEGTYGDRIHDEAISICEQIKRTLLETVDKGGKLIIPAFAVGRTEELLLYIKELYRELDETYRVPVYVDSPLAIAGVDKFKQNREYLTADIKKEIESFKELKLVSEAEESACISMKDESMIIVSASGMADFGRIKEHLKNNISDERNAILFSGYLAEGTLGREIKKEKRNIKIQGEKYKQRAKVRSLQGMSGHVDMNGLLAFIKNFKQKPKQIYINHGSPESKENLKRELEKTLKNDTKVLIPKKEQVYEISERLGEKVKTQFDMELLYNEKLSIQERILLSIYGENITNYACFQTNSEMPSSEHAMKQMENLSKLGYRVS